MATPRKTKTKKHPPAVEGSGAKPEAKAARGKRQAPEAPETVRVKSPAKQKAKPPAKTADTIKVASVPARKATAKATVRPKEIKKAESTRAAPRKPVVDAEFLKQMREALIHQRQRLLSVVRSTQAQMAEKTKDLPDVSDQASEGYGDELAVGLMAIEAAQLEDIEAAISRIDDSSYGLCEECEKPIPRKRLEVLPFVRRCLACEGQHEHRLRIQPSYVEEDEPQ